MESNNSSANQTFNVTSGTAAGNLNKINLTKTTILGVSVERLEALQQEIDKLQNAINSYLLKEKISPCHENISILRKALGYGDSQTIHPLPPCHEFMAGCLNYWNSRQANSENNSGISDAERINWLESRCDIGAIQFDRGLEMRDEVVWNVWGFDGVPKTFREAVDRKMQQEKNGELVVEDKDAQRSVEFMKKKLAEAQKLLKKSRKKKKK